MSIRISFCLLFIVFFSFQALAVEYVDLPPPRLKGEVSLEEALLNRRSIRSYSKEVMTLKELSQLLWAGNGVTEPKRGFRTAPSAGALYPIDVYLVVNRVEGLREGVYRYIPKEHKLEVVRVEPLSRKIYELALWQSAIMESSVVFVLVAFYERITWKYGQRGIRYAHMECGHIAQNILLQATALRLGAVPIGAFKEEIAGYLGVPQGGEVVYLIPVGKLKH